MASVSVNTLQKNLEAATRKYQDLQDDLSKAVEARERLAAQQVESENVKKEFAGLKPENTVYKLIGPILIPQDQSEAKSNVEKRLDFITAELKRVENQITEIGEQSERAKTEIVQIQTAYQALQQQKSSESSK
ncbi:SubName: Full=Related to YKE2-Gim complex component {ECO:0000313/EMBL:CCA69033.1} [Serendipita indica DSM 11827]|uniref:Related to YKE2-Gim complex component n=1 Tax=Serendipita indica (strain DSM 11827) TaxID=1109443 RepID=G4TCI0_SERID|nr:SubName: Full=Related to YKE2-Gim complex component {ECO:0000313/EMBL:CCA69033.1} [Serendipita indica DSM 11827]CCA69033.1 related to YKE2-Gim complex component [Serendipita indica DSM 11827]